MTDLTFDAGGTAAINWIYQSYNTAKPYTRPGLDKDTRHPEWTSRILEQLSNPDKKMYNISVTGSKGKGSHAILIAAMLEKMGFRVGLFTGPHLVDFMERFRINGELIPEVDFIRYVDELRSVTQDFDLPQDQYLGPVGLLAVIAVKWFFEQGTDINVFELGRGALHDDVNRVAHVGAVMSPVFLEHTAQLGNTFSEVGAEKAGIVTEDTRWVCSHPQTATVQEIVKSSCDAGQALYVLGDDISVQDTSVHHPSCQIQVRTPFGLCDVLLPAAQYHLADNVAVALSAAQKAALDRRPGMVLPSVLDLRNLSLPGRLQTVSEHPEVVVDGTIHGRSAAIVRSFIRSRRLAPGHTVCRIGAIIGIPADKDGVGVLKTLSDVLDFIVICRAHNPHLSFDDGLSEVAKEFYDEAYVVEYLEDGLEIARRHLDGESDMLMILGTQSLVGDAMKVFQVDTRSIWRRASLMQSRGSV